MGDPSCSGSFPRLVSVVLPVRNGGLLIQEQLGALSRQTIEGPWELVVADNGSDDGTPDAVRAWTGRLPLRVVDASDAPGVGHARNVGARAARGDLLAFCDADDIVADRWLEALTAAASAGAALVSGPIDPTLLNDGVTRAWRPAIARDRLPVSCGFLPYAFGANLAVRADDFAALGGFREDLVTADDVEFCWRAQLAGRSLAFAPGAVVHYRYRTELRDMLRQFSVYGSDAVRLYREYRTAGMPPSPLPAALRRWLRLLLALVASAGDRAARGDVLRRLAMRWGRLKGSLRYRVGYF